MLDSKQQYKLRKIITELRGIRGRHTELVSVYIPAGYDIIKIIQHLAQEQGTASNIKDKTTRLNVQDSLDRMVRHLRLYTKLPPNGLAAFSGNIASQEGKKDIKVWSIEPPVPLGVRLYRCDQTFVLGPLEDMMHVNEIYGLIVMDNREATIGFLKGKSIQVTRDFSSSVPGKVKVGGWSQARYARLREDAANEFYKRIADVLNVEFASVGKDLKGILVGGPGPTKETFVNGAYIHTELKKKILAIKDIAYTDEQGLHELVDRSQDVLAEAEIAKEKKLLNEFFTLLSTSSDKVIYGSIDVKKALDYGAVDKLLISETFGKVEEFEEQANATGTAVFIISVETKEGAQLKELGGVAAILRYAIKDL